MRILTFNNVNFIFSLIQYKLLKKFYKQFDEYIVYTNNLDIYNKLISYNLECILSDEYGNIENKYNQIIIDSNVFITSNFDTEDFKNLNLMNTECKYIQEENFTINEEKNNRYFYILDQNINNILNIYDYINRTYNDLAIFFITFNRTDTMIKTLNSYKKFFKNTNFNIVIINNGSDSHKTIELLNEFEKEYKIYNKNIITYLNELDKNIDEVLFDYTNKINNIKYYAVCDSDICFDISNINTLNIYMELCNKLNYAVGPELEIKDIPDYYLLKYYVLRISYRNLLSSLKKSINLNGSIVNYTCNPIDTTFILFKKDKNFNRLKRSTIRTLEPYNVQHLDWYINILNPSEEVIIYMNKKSAIGSYGGSYIKSLVELFKSDIDNKSKLDKILDIVNNKIVNDHSIEHYILSCIYANDFLGIKNIDLAKKYLIEAAPNGAFGTETAEGSYKCSNENLFNMCFENNFEWTKYN